MLVRKERMISVTSPIIILCVLFCRICSVFAQPTQNPILSKSSGSPVPAKPPATTVALFDVEDGLAISAIFSSLVDSQGNIWFGTLGAGVSRYNGSNFKNYNATHGLAGNIVTAIAEDNNRNLWFATMGGGISRFDGISFTTFPMNEGLAQSYVISAFKDSHGQLWFGTFNGGVSVFDGTKFRTFSTSDGLQSDSVWCVAEDAKGMIYFGTEKGISSFDGTRIAPISSLPQTSVRSILVDEHENIWAGTANSGVYRISKTGIAHYTTSNGLCDNAIWKITKDATGTIWIATEHGGIATYNGVSFSSISHDGGLPSDNVTTLSFDRRGNLWFGTLGQGVGRFDRNGIHSYNRNQGLPHSNVHQITEDHLGNLWFATLGGGGVKFDGREFFQFSMRDGLSSNSVRRILEDRNHNIWFGTHGGGVTRFDGRTYKTYDISNGLPDNHVRALFEDRTGQIWIGTDGGFSIINDAGIRSFTGSDGLPHVMVWDILQDSSGNYWFATYGGGLIWYDGSRFKSFTTSDGLCSNSVVCLYLDERSNLWIGGATGGLSRYDGDSFLTFGKSQHIPDETVYDIIGTQNGQIWIGTNRGLASLRFVDQDKKEINPGYVEANNAIVKSTLSPQWNSYNLETGYAIKDVNTNAMTFSKLGFPFGNSEKGRIWAGCGDDKVVSFDISALHSYSAPPNIVITNLKVNDEEVCWYLLDHNDRADTALLMQQEMIVYNQVLKKNQRDTINLRFKNVSFEGLTKFANVPMNPTFPHTMNRITFDFNAIDPSLYKQINYQFKLVGQEDQWSPVVNTTETTYSNLWEGNYVFQVRARVGDGPWSEPLAYHFSISPPWWRLPWMYALYSFVAIAGIALIIKKREKGLIREKKRLEEIVKQRTNEVLTQMRQADVEKLEAQKQRMEADLQRSLAEQKNQELLQELAKSESSLSGLTLEMMDRFHAYTELEQELRKLAVSDDPNKFKKAFSLISLNKSHDKEWEQFNLYFDSVHKDFSKKLLVGGTQISNYELRMCALIKMGFGNKEIAMLLNIEPASVKMAKYRLKKKLQLDDAVELQEYLQSL